MTKYVALAAVVLLAGCMGKPEATEPTAAATDAMMAAPSDAPSADMSAAPEATATP